MQKSPLFIRLLCLAVFLLPAACSWTGSPKTPAETPPKTERDLSGYSGTFRPEAEQAFAEARVLWRRQLSTLADAETCSDPAKAVALLDKAIALEPGYAEAYARRGLAKSQLGDREGAFDDLTSAIRLRPSAEQYAFRGLVSLRGRAMRAAEKDLDYSIKLDASQSRAYNLRGMLALNREDTPGACEAFTQGCDNGDCTFLEAVRKDKLCP